MKVTRVLLARHGETTWNAEGRLQGQSDAPLSDVGRAHTRLLAAHLRPETLSAIYTSDLSRAVETARTVAATHGLDPCPVVAFREVSYGAWEGLTQAEVRERYPDEHRLWNEDSVAHRPPGGERLETVRDRTLAGLAGLLDRHQGETLLVVSHGAAIRCLLAGLLDVPLRAMRSLVLRNASLSRVIFGAGRPVLVSLNETGHL